MTPALLARASFASLLALIALCLAWELWLAPLEILFAVTFFLAAIFCARATRQA